MILKFKRLSTSGGTRRRYSTFLKKPSWSIHQNFLVRGEKRKVDIQRLAKLSYLSSSSFLSEKSQQDFENILQFFRQIQVVDTKNVEPLYSILDNVQLETREDVALKSGQQEILNGAILKKDGYFVVPKVKDVDLF